MRDELVLDTLKKSGKQGVTAYDFPKALHFKDAVLKLRARGHKITMQMIPDPKGLKRNIGLYRWTGKQDKPFCEVADYQQMILEKIRDIFSIYTPAKTVSDLAARAPLLGYQNILEKCKLSKGILDFINTEITNYNLRSK